MMQHFFSRLTFLYFFVLVFTQCKEQKSSDATLKVENKSTIDLLVPMTVADRVVSRDFPSVFQAWNGIDMPEYPLNELDEKLKTAAKHDLIWEEPLSQASMGNILVLGLVWDNVNHGLADSFTKESLEQALANKKRLLELNPNMVFLFEVRWRDAPSSFLPEDSEMWLRDDNGEIKKGWEGGPEPYYILNYKNEKFVENVARQSKLAIDSGVYDGVMFDWNGDIDIIKKTRQAIGDDGLIIVNIHDNIEDGKKYKDYINGAFMELNPKDDSYSPDYAMGTWESIGEALQYFENNFRKPVVNCLEIMGERDDLQRMQAATSLALTHSNGYVLFGDRNALETPDHLHDWYPFWDTDLGVPTGTLFKRDDGAYQREFTNGLVIYNPEENKDIDIEFDAIYRRVSNSEKKKTFAMAKRDGDIFLAQ